MHQLYKVLLILVVLSVASSAELRRSKNAHKQQQMAEEIIKNNFKITLERDTTVQKKISIMNFVEESRSLKKNLPTFTQRTYDEFTKTISKYERVITQDKKDKYISMIQTKNAKNRSQLINHGNTFYTGMVSVGYQDQQYKMIFDTGSTLIFLNSIKCESVGCIRGNQYDSDRSPTFKDALMEVEVEFGSGIIKGEMGIDNFYLADLTVKQVKFMEMTEQDGAVFEAGDFDGLIGLAFPALGEGVYTIVDYMYESNAIPRKLFSFYMSRKDESNTSFVSFGSVDSDVINGEIHYHKVSSPLYWTILAEEIRLGGHNTGLCTQEFPCPLAIDSGTSIIAGPSDATDYLVNLILDRGYGCDQINKMPTLSFIVDGEEYPLLSQEYMISTNGVFANMYEHSNDPIECSPAFVPLDIEEPSFGPLWIMGDIFMTKYYTVFDREQQKVGFGKLNNLDKKFYQNPPKKNDDEFNFDFLKRRQRPTQ